MGKVWVNKSGLFDNSGWVKGDGTIAKDFVWQISGGVNEDGFSFDEDNFYLYFGHHRHPQEIAIFITKNVISLTRPQEEQITPILTSFLPGVSIRNRETAFSILSLSQTTY